ncbi:MAG: DNA-directed RNA polymerase subunit L [Thermoplasmatales archaeon]|nr:MAG: DNA-directed RNA polymerase subunit L [Thermoplasmatales archaeon]
MELKTIKKTTKELILEITGETETLLNPVAEVLLDYDDVDYASYMSDHPESKKRRLYIRVKKGKPEEILKKAVKQLEDEIKTFSKSFVSKSKSKK